MLQETTKIRLRSLPQAPFHQLLSDAIPLDDDHISQSIGEVHDTHATFDTLDYISDEHLEQSIASQVTASSDSPSHLLYPHMGDISFQSLAPLFDHPRYEAGVREAADCIISSPATGFFQQHTGYAYPGDEIGNIAVEASCWCIVAAADVINSIRDAVDASPFSQVQLRAATILTSIVILITSTGIEPAAATSLLLALDQNDTIYDAATELVQMANDRLSE